MDVVDLPVISDKKLKQHMMLTTYSKYIVLVAIKMIVLMIIKTILKPFYNANDALFF